MNEHIFLPRDAKSCRRILVVDDEPYVRRLNTEVLVSYGYEVAVAEDGVAAWDELQLNDYDLLLTDNEMPRLTGLGLVRRLQDAHLAVPVIMLTGTPPHDQLASEPDLQVEAVLLKPYTLDELLNAIKNVLHASNTDQAEIAPPNWQRPANDDRQRAE